MKTPEVDLFQYHVDFHPQIEHQGVRKDLVRVHRDILKKYVFHGNLLYTTTPLAQVYIYSFINSILCVLNCKQFKCLTAT